jgi:hypothetical protein
MGYNGSSAIFQGWYLAKNGSGQARHPLIISLEG